MTKKISYLVTVWGITKEQAYRDNGLGGPLVFECNCQFIRSIKLRLMQFNTTVLFKSFCRLPCAYISASLLNICLFLFTSSQLFLHDETVKMFAGATLLRL